MTNKTNNLKIFLDNDIEQSRLNLLTSLQKLEDKLRLITEQNPNINADYHRYVEENVELHNVVNVLKEALETQRNENKNIRNITSELMNEISDYIIELEKIKKYYADFAIKNK